MGPCGLMDQMACSVGNLVYIDFENPSEPKVEKLDFNMADYGYSLCITDTKGSHADLTDEYAAVPKEMKLIANYFKKEVLRAMHFFLENQRVEKEVDSLKQKNINDFLSSVKDSGNSSFKYLQNVYSNNDVKNQNVSVALMMSDFGDGFAGTIQAFVKRDFVSTYKTQMDNIFGKNSCKDLRIRKYGGIKVL